MVAGAGAPEIDFLSGSFFVERGRDAYRWLREHAPVHLDANSGFWGISRYDDVRSAGSDWKRFSSAGGSRPESGPLPWMIDLDGESHAKRRKLVSRGFTPGRVRASEPHLREICEVLGVSESRVCQLHSQAVARLRSRILGADAGAAVKGGPRRGRPPKKQQADA